MKLLKTLLPHILFILSGIFITLLILDIYNPTMNFIDNPVSLKLFWAFCILSLAHSVILILSKEKNPGQEKSNDMKKVV